MGSLRCLFFFICFYHITITPQELLAQPLPDDDVCQSVSCGQGKCVPLNSTILGIPQFDCDCDPGWNKVKIGPISFPTCTVPNCTVNFACGSQAPPAPPPPPAALNLPFLSPCALVWCGEGQCVVDGTGYYCKCNDGSANFLNMTGAACLKQCYFGADCASGVPLGPPAPPPGNQFGSPRRPPQPVNGLGSSNVPNCSPSFQQITMWLLSVILVAASI